MKWNPDPLTSAIKNVVTINHACCFANGFQPVAYITGNKPFAFVGKYQIIRLKPADSSFKDFF